MAVELATAYVSIVPTTSGIGAALQSQIVGPMGGVGAQAGGALGSSMGKAAAAAGGILLARSAANFFGGTLEAAREANRISAITEATIKATGNAAGTTAKEIGDLAAAISKKTGVDDEAIQVGANQLLTFKSIRNEVGKGNDVFDRATQAAVDLSAHGFGSIDSASVQLGKALEDPIKGLTALRRVGVTFTEQQREQITTLAESGRTLEAQTLLLAAVEGQVGGTAEAAATGSDKLKVAYGNLSESIGNALVPVMETLANVLTPIVEAFTALPGPVQSGIVVVGMLGAGVLVAGFAVSAFSTALSSLGILSRIGPMISGFVGVLRTVSLALLTPPLGIVIAIAAVILALGWFLTQTETGKDILAAFGDTMAAVGGALFDFGAGIFEFIENNWKPLLAVLGGPFGLIAVLVITHITTIKDTFLALGDTVTAVVGWIVDRWNGIVDFFVLAPGRIADAARGMWDGIKDAFRSALNWIIRAWNGLDFTLPSINAFGVKIGGFTIGLPDIPLLADGGRATSAGLAIVGERGAEIVKLNAGDSIHPNGAMPGVSGVQFGDINVHEARDARRTAFEVLREAAKRSYLAGVT